MKREIACIVKFSFIFILSFVGMREAIAGNTTIKNDTFWKDTDGNPIYSQGGGILKVGDTYYWYGMKYKTAVTYERNPIGTSEDSSFSAVTVYSSKDLVIWKNEGSILDAEPDGSYLDSKNWVGRLGVVYNKSTKKYVLVTQYSSKTNGSGILFATSDSPTGAFKIDRLQTKIINVVTPTAGDQTTFVDDDGQAYLIFCDHISRTRIYVAPLRTSDFLNVEPATEIYHSLIDGKETKESGREGNAMFKYNGVYYACASALHGWNTSPTYCMSANNIYGPYSPEFIMKGSTADFSHVSQTGFFISVKGSKATTIINAGDRWSNFAGNGIGYNQWVPLSFEGFVPVFNSLSEFTLDEKTGAWAVGGGNNYVLNPSFEADRRPNSTLTGWTGWAMTETVPFGNVLDAHTGRWAMQLLHSSEYKAGMTQELVVPNGIYEFKAWVKSSGGQKTAELSVKDFGGSEKVVSINSPITNWQQVSISNIRVTKGKIKIDIGSDAFANNWIKVDDLTLIKK